MGDRGLSSFNVGAVGEQRAAQRVQDLCSADVLFLQNRKLRLGWRDVHLDLVAVGPGGVYVVDVKYHKGKKVEVRRAGGLSSPVREQLFIGDRDKTDLLESVARKSDAVRKAMIPFPGSEQVPVTTAMCFFDAELPLFGSMRIGFVPCLAPTATAKLLSSPGLLDSAARLALHDHLARTLPPAD
jgi:Nuclease-related domain